MRANQPARLPVVAGVDGSAHALRAVRWAAREAAARDVELVLIDAIGLPDLMVGGVAQPTIALRTELRRRGEALLRVAETMAAKTAPTRIERRLDEDLPAPALVRAGQAARMLVLGSTGRDAFLSGLVLGSTAIAVAAHADCPVVVVRGREAHAHDPVVVGVDDSPLSEAALGCAFEAADLYGTELIAVHVWSDRDPRVALGQSREFFEWKPPDGVEERVLAERVTGWSEKYPDVRVTCVVRASGPRNALLELSERAQLTVVGSRGRGGFRGLLLGSVSQALIHHAGCPVMVVRPTTQGPG